MFPATLEAVEKMESGVGEATSERDQLERVVDARQPVEVPRTCCYRIHPATSGVVNAASARTRATCQPMRRWRSLTVARSRPLARPHASGREAIR
jgi:hypothetical protein